MLAVWAGLVYDTSKDILQTKANKKQINKT